MSNNNKTPAIRFKGFTDTWEQRKLDTLVEFYSGLTYKPEDVTENGTLVLRSSNVKNAEVVLTDNVYVDESVVNSENVKKDDIIVVVRNGSKALIGKHAKIRHSMPNTVIGAFMTGIRSDSPDFINALLSTDTFDKEIKMNMGATINQITGYMFANMEFMTPSFQERQAVGSFFSRLDDLITLHQRKYDKLIQFKAAMLEKMFPQNGADKPEIRFRGFTDGWEQRKLSDTLNFLSNNTLSRAELSEDTGTYKNVHYGDVLIKFGEYIDAQSTDLPYIADDEKAKKFESSKLQDGDIIIADTAEDEAVGKCVEIGNIGDLSIVSGLHTIPCRPKVKFAPAYLGFYLNSASYHDQLIPLMQGIKVTSISKSAISDTMISAPTNLSEQGKIGQFFTQLDSLITLHQRKCDKYKSIKAGLIRKLFP